MFVDEVIVVTQRVALCPLTNQSIYPFVPCRHHSLTDFAELGVLGYVARDRLPRFRYCFGHAAESSTDRSRR